MAPHVHLDPPRLDYLVTVHLPSGPGRYRAFTCRTDNPAQWLQFWEEDWQAVAADLWDYEGPGTTVKSTVDVSAVLKLNAVPEGFRRRV